MTRSQELQEPLGATPAQEAGKLVLRLLGNHGRAGNRRKMGFKLKQEANSSKYRLMGENVSSPGRCGSPGTSPSPETVSKGGDVGAKTGRAGEKDVPQAETWRWEEPAQFGQQPRVQVC